MRGIVGAAGPNRYEDVARMLRKMNQTVSESAILCGNERYALAQAPAGTSGDTPAPDCPLASGNASVLLNGAIYNLSELCKQCRAPACRTRLSSDILLHLERVTGDCCQWLRGVEGMFALAMVCRDRLILARDPLGIKPLYVGRERETGSMVFASDVTALLEVCDKVAEFPPGHVYVSGEGLRSFFSLGATIPEVNDVEAATRGVLRRLTRSVRASMGTDTPPGVFLSGGLDSALIAAIARRLHPGLNTFWVGFPDDPNRERACLIARHLETKHHERTYSMPDVIEALPEIVCLLGSFDRTLVRSAIPYYFLTRFASKRARVALSGEGADELFAGYEYLRALESEALHAELLRLTGELHSTHLPRCERMGQAHEIEVRLPFLDDADLVAYAFRLSTDLKVRGPQRISKWILRRAATGLIPREIVHGHRSRPTAVGALAEGLARYAEQRISDTTFARERQIAPDRVLRSKEELLYYRLLREQVPVERLLPLLGQCHHM
ncbi:MAG: asparagine synthase-related protein [Chloroherpetonaceae bacterium]|nr:asparagine synthase-related protein [Chthonomonadaceae bacterium]MDW8206610.1 asparagine synthase-related protein [Chloroherpetonaceae bacterium]